MQLTLDLFKPINKEIDLNNKAIALLNLLNEGSKKRDFFEPINYAQIEDLIVLMAENKEKEKLFNVIDLKGNIPKGFSVNWRIANHVKSELKEYFNN